MYKSITFFSLFLVISIATLINSQPKAHYTFTEMSGNSLIDHSGNNNHGQINGAVWQQSSGLRSLSFNGSSNYVNVPHNSLFNFGSGDFTIEVTFKTSVIPTTSWVALVSKHNTANWHDREFFMMIEGSTGFPVFGLSTEQGVFERAIGNINVCDGMFHTVRGVRQGNQLKLYVDGDLKATAAATINTNNTNPINIGRSSYNNGYGYFNGTISNVAIWNSALVVTPVEHEDFVLISDYILYSSYPNPFNPYTNIKFSIPNREFVTLKVFDVLGNEIATLIDEEKFSGDHSVTFNAKNLSSGVYMYRIQAGSFTETKKMTLIK